MSKYVSKDRLRHAIDHLNGFRQSVNAQGLQHVLPFLALKEKGANPDDWVTYEESDDFDFWDRYFKVSSGQYPYYDPFAGQRRIASHPHSNVATARKGTFVASWHAAATRRFGDANQYRLEADYLDVVVEKCLTKSGATSRVPAVDLIAWMRRTDSLPDDATEDSLVEQFQQRFNLTTMEYGRLFGSETTEGAGE